MTSPYQHRENRKALLARQFAELDYDVAKDAIVASMIDLDPTAARDAIVASWNAGEQAERAQMKAEMLAWVAREEARVDAAITASARRTHPSARVQPPQASVGPRRARYSAALKTLRQRRDDLLKGKG